MFIITDTIENEIDSKGKTKKVTEVGGYDGSKEARKGQKMLFIMNDKGRARNLFFLL